MDDLTGNRTAPLLARPGPCNGGRPAHRAARLPLSCLHLACLVLAGLPLAGTGVAEAAVSRHEGEARDPDTRRLLYREEHLVRHEGDAPSERLVLYRCPDRTAFARKRVDYRRSRLAPEFELVDARGHREGLRREGARTLVWSGDAPPKTLAATQAPLVADAGFDEFLRMRWTLLAAGEPQRLAFAVPAYGRSLNFRIAPKAGGGTAPGAPQRFELRIDGVLGRMLPGITVDYDREDRRLQRFLGVTNIRDAQGDQVRAEILFPRRPQPADDRLWQAAGAEPLVACTLGG